MTQPDSPTPQPAPPSSARPSPTPPSLSSVHAAHPAHPAPPPPAVPAPRGGGAAGELLRAHDWSASSLGPLAQWDAALRTSTDIVLNSPAAMLLLWGPEHVMIYNDGYAAIAGAHHPAALGARVEQAWPEAWSWNRGALAAALRGEPGVAKDRHLVLMRAAGGLPDDGWFDLYYTPVHEAGGGVAGVMVTVIETTDRVERQRKLVNESEALGELNRGLKGERAMLRALFEQAPGFMAVLRGPDHRFELTNRPYLDLVGPRALIGRSVAEALPEVAEQGFIALLDQVYASGVAYVGKAMKVVLRPDGGADAVTRYVDFVYQPVRDGGGAVDGIFVEGVDVTERIVAEERLRLAQQAGGIGSFEWFPDSGKMVVSQTYRRIWGLDDAQEVNADLLVALVEPADRAKVGPSKLARAGNPLDYVEYRVRRPVDGQLRWIARQGEVMEGDTPAQLRYVGVSFDVTARKQTEQALRASQDRLAAIFGQASVGLSELDLAGNFRRVNGALCQMLGRDADALLGLNMEDLIHPDDLADNRALLALLIDTGAPFTLEKRYRKPDLSWVWISSSMSRLDDEFGQPQALIAVKTDITERHRIELAWRELNETLEQRVGREVAERDKAEEALRQSQKMEAVGQLTGGVAHDFNNVLQIISGNLQLLHQHSDGDSSNRRRLDTAIAAVERGAKLSSQLLAFARRQPLQPVALDLGRLLAEMDELLRRAVGETVDIALQVGAGLWNTLVDPGQLESVILNLAINARDAMRGEGRLSIELGNAVLGEYDVKQLTDVVAGQYVQLTVSDTGCGMTEEVLKRAFEPFFTTKPEGEGTGLGLSMAYGFVKQSRGHIRIDSVSGAGTSVRIYLPRSMLAEVRPEPEPPRPVSGGTETVLVAEDDAGVRATVVDMLSALGYRVLQADGGEQALRLLRDGAAVDLLFTDVVMPGPLRSPDLALRARALLPDIAVLFTSGYPQNAIVHEGRLDAGVELLSKPYRREDLARKLSHMLANRRQQMQARQRLVDDSGAAPLAAPGTSLRILVVEDNLDSQQMVCELVGMLGHTVSGVADGETAWRLMAEQSFDILFTDVSLPGMSGITLARQVARAMPDTRIVFSTGYGKEALDQLEFKASFLRKPYDLLELKAALDQQV
ncbi:PAS domain S-box protein [Rugamonas sp.]|uniref:hybrid sensor histidine kinase/response regulator n=1 Tax=Rugamonas sp. TaxID=1926287 RepID=UPI0025D2FBDD|nr:PAS domain S-box protein [Rugamonas sp.]